MGEWNEFNGGPLDGNRVRVDYVGPFQETRVVVDGRQVPLLTAYLPPGGIVQLTLDGRFGLDVPVDIADNVVWFIAECIAVAMGYSCFPRRDEDPVPRNHFPRLTEIMSMASDDHEGDEA